MQPGRGHLVSAIPSPPTRGCADGTARCLLVLGHDALAPEQLGSIEALRSLDALILLDTHRSALEQVASVVMPGLHVTEKAGTLTNHAGVQQKVEAALEPRRPALAEGNLLRRVLARLRPSDHAEESEA